MKKGLALLPSALHQLRRLYWRTFRPRTFGVSVLVVDDSERVLLIRNTYRTGWHLPGGAVKRGERSVDAALREVREETGIQARNLPSRVLGVYANFAEGNFDYVTVYVVSEWDKREDVKTNFEICEVAWFPLQDLPADTGHGTRRRVEEYLGRCALQHDW